MAKQCYNIFTSGIPTQTLGDFKVDSFTPYRLHPIVGVGTNKIQ
jgi:hypothetical protein